MKLTAQDRNILARVNHNLGVSPSYSHSAGSDNAQATDLVAKREKNGVVRHQYCRAFAGIPLAELDVDTVNDIAAALKR